MAQQIIEKLDYRALNKQQTLSETEKFDISFASFFSDMEIYLSPKNKKESLTQSELDSLTKKAEETQTPEEHRDQHEMTVKEIDAAAVTLINNPAFKFFETKFAPTNEKKIRFIVYMLEKFLIKLTKFYKKKDIHLPLLSNNVRNIVKKIFTNTVPINGESVYHVLGVFNMYALFHSFCTQMVPVNLNFDFANTNQQKPSEMFRFSKRLLNILSPDRVSSSISSIDKQNFKENKKWISNDKETRIKIAKEMFGFIKKYLIEHPNEDVSIIEPGAGNGEFTSILAEMIFEDEITRGRANLILKEYSFNMIKEGKNKFERLQKKLEKKHNINVDLKIHYICGSAETSLEDQLNEIKTMIGARKDDAMFKKFSLTPQESQNLLSSINQTKVIGAVSTYTLGAMGDRSRKIVEQTMQDVSSKGKIIIVDFAKRPPDNYLNNHINDNEEKEKTTKRRNIFDSFAKLGFSQGLAINFGLWEHDVLQIWKVFHQIQNSHKQKVELSSTVDLKPFALLPLSRNKQKKEDLKVVAIPGYFEMFIRTGGLADPNYKIDL